MSQINKSYPTLGILYSTTEQTPTAVKDWSFGKDLDKVGIEECQRGFYILLGFTILKEKPDIKVRRVGLIVCGGDLYTPVPC
jgi:hypothetical protein